MIRINLLPFRAARKKENVRRQVTIFALSTVLLVVGLGWYHMSLGSQVAAMERQVADTETELRNLEKKLKEIKRIQTILATIRRKTAVIEDLELGREAAVRLLDAMTQLVIKEQMYLTQLKVSRSDIEMQGMAADNQTIADFMMRLENSGIFNRVVLQSTAASKTASGLNLQKFGITCQQKPLKRAETEGNPSNKAGKK